jgi:hypothetical protein
MTSYRLPRLLVAGAAVAGLAVAATTSGAQPAAHDAGKAHITRNGVDGVKVGMTYKKLRKHHLVHKIHQGCEVAGPNARSARLVKPIKGFVNFTLHHPRRVTDIQIRGGATARGVGIHDTIADIKQQYPNAKEDHSTDDTFGLTVVRTPKRHGRRIEFAVDTDTHKIVRIGVPHLAFCE